MRDEPAGMLMAAPSAQVRHSAPVTAASRAVPPAAERARTWPPGLAIGITIHCRTQPPRFASVRLTDPDPIWAAMRTLALTG
jgi:hypothetical protein